MEAVGATKGAERGREGGHDRLVHPFDVHVGGRVRLRRRHLGMSQDTLARAVDITFQQVQKYERGATRISASRLYDMATVLGVSVGFLCQGFDDECVAPALLDTVEGSELISLFMRLRSPRQRQCVVDLVRSMVDV